MTSHCDVRLAYLLTLFSTLSSNRTAALLNLSVSGDRQGHMFFCSNLHFEFDDQVNYEHACTCQLLPKFGLMQTQSTMEG